MEETPGIKLIYLNAEELRRRWKGIGEDGKKGKNIERRGLGVPSEEISRGMEEEWIEKWTREEGGES